MVITIEDDEEKVDFSKALLWNRPRRLKAGINVADQVVCSSCKERALVKTPTQEFYPLYLTAKKLDELNEESAKLEELRQGSSKGFGNGAFEALRALK